MGGEKYGTKGGGYVGGFLQLFDWNAKARKKLSWTKSDLSGTSYHTTLICKVDVYALCVRAHTSVCAFILFF